MEGICSKLSAESVLSATRGQGQLIRTPHKPEIMF